MTAIEEQFACALQSHLGSEYQAVFVETVGSMTPAQARQGQFPADSIARAQGDVAGIVFTESIAEMPISSEFITRIPISFARRHNVIALSGGNGDLTVVMADIAQWPQAQILSKMFGKTPRPLLSTKQEIHRAINAAYQQQSGHVQSVIDELDKEQILSELQEVTQNEDLLDVSSRAPVVKLVNLVLFEAVQRRASDLHIQPYEDKLVVRYRVDGILFDILEPPKALQQEIVSRVKVMGGMNIAERRLPQDGRATVEVGDRLIDLRIATLPTCFGERVVIRLLDKSARLYRLEDLGMPSGMQESFGRLIRNDHGIVLVTGPTGSGKSTTLYAALQEINSQERNVLTLEDPIEYRLEGISQTQINEKKGMTFASGLRNVLRQDPDVIMVGEIRDGETARMAIQSALTGHLVFSTLHTNDAAGAVARMLDLGVEPYLVASSLLGVVAQRLVRKICPHCKQAYKPSHQELAGWGVEEKLVKRKTLYRGAGCSECMNTGYHERIGVFELLAIDESIRELILQRAKASSIKAAAVAGGMASLHRHGLARAMEGVTSMEEVVRVTGRDEF